MHPRTSRRLVAALVVSGLLLVAPVAAASQSRPATVAGIVRAPGGEPVAGVAVRSDGAATATAADGGYQLEGLTAGRHEVAFLPPAQYESTTARVSLGEGEREQLDVVLTAAALPLVRLAGDGREETAVLASRAGFAEGARSVVIAAAGAFPDALAAAPLAAREGGPLLLVSRRTATAVLAEVARLGAERAVIVGAVGAVPVVVQAELERAGLQVRRIAGDGRFDTAALIAREVGAPDGEAVVASGGSFADALAAAPLAAAQGMPILLTAHDALPADTEAALAALGVSRTLVVGGTQAVAEAVAAGLPAPRRVAGADRYATAAAVAALLLQRGGSASTVAVSTGRNYPDALAAGPLAATTRGPLLLVDGADPSAADPAYEFLTAHFAEVTQVLVLGGEAAVSPATASRVERPASAPDRQAGGQ